MEISVEYILYGLQNNLFDGKRIFVATDKLSLDMFDFDSSIKKDMKKVLDKNNELSQLILLHNRNYNLIIEHYHEKGDFEKCKTYKHSISHDNIRNLIETIGPNNFYDINCEKLNYIEKRC